MARSKQPKGKFVTWELALTDDNRDFFQKVIGKKDELSGFHSMKEDRYFPRHSETIKNFKLSDIPMCYILLNPNLLSRLKKSS